MIKKRINGKFYTMDDADFAKFGKESENPCTVTAYYISISPKNVVATTALFKFTFESNEPEWQTITDYLQDLGIKPVVGFTTRIVYKVETPDEIIWRFHEAVSTKTVYRVMKFVGIL